MKNLKIKILGIKEGITKDEFVVSSEKLFDEKNEFFGEIDISLVLKYNNGKYNISGTCEADALLKCDISGEDFEQEIVADFQIMFKIDGPDVKLFDEQLYNDDILELKENFLFFDNLIKEELLLAIPLKKISPKYQDKEFKDVFPEYSKNNNEDKGDDAKSPWNELKKIRFN